VILLVMAKLGCAIKATGSYLLMWVWFQNIANLISKRVLGIIKDAMQLERIVYSTTILGFISGGKGGSPPFKLGFPPLEF